MKDWVPDLSKASGYRYRALAEAIRAAVQSGELEPGERLLSHRHMAWKAGVTIATVARAYQIAGEWGVVYSKVGHGTRVREAADSRRPLVLREESNHMVNFGLLLATPLTESALRKQAFTSVFAHIGTKIVERSLSGYAPDLGYRAHRDLGATWIKSLGDACESENLTITRGAQEAFLILLSMLTQPGDPVLVEETTYLGLAHMLRLRKHNMVATPMDAEGMMPDELNERARSSKARLLFVSPTLQNPTGATMSLERRQAIVDVARSNDLLIIEDNPFAALVGGQCLTSISSLAPERTFPLYSLSKYVAPAMRVCFMRCPSAHIQMLEGVKHALTLGGPFLQAEIAAEWLRRGILKKLCDWQAEEMRRRWALARSAFGHLIPRDASPCPFIFLHLPETWRAGEFVSAARAARVSCIEADRFTVGRASAPQAVRLSLSSPVTDDEFRLGIARLSGLLACNYVPSSAIRY
ncbi:MAG: PLP-dependent aminotransferase family protein [Mesorhizobium sp.]|uniref:aminotransferase-like domain-containing protein n=1 Tax=Mesorhizobium sp. TaxID=1871066 RepID=UPI000FE90F39|nr:PLP-dependent aminotransferase family protein [Mesorhizobium sp.]RWL90241.1 MAG: PLP-dependent aminotransferase family protein [Mesorhizobium sp.]